MLLTRPGGWETYTPARDPRSPAETLHEIAYGDAGSDAYEMEAWALDVTSDIFRGDAAVAETLWRAFRSRVAAMPIAREWLPEAEAWLYFFLLERQWRTLSAPAYLMAAGCAP